MSDEPDRSDGRSERGSNGGDDEGATWSDRFLMATSVVFTVVLFSFVIWQASMTPTAAVPTATVTGTQTLSSGDVKVELALQNAQDVGLVMATVEVDCDTPPPELTFEHVPVDDRRTGYVTCPPGTETPTATVSSWAEA